ncbi:MAG TPA: deoxyribonuclease IV [Thermoanaerobaculia bacterium]|nr:deoxyribonuclease IV [Thermoanaerobaculia bacterium]
MPRPPLGAHVSIAGGLPLAFERAAALDCEAIQIFVKNASQWQGRRLDDAEVVAFRAARRESKIGAVIAHASYLINLAARERTVRRRSIRGLADELGRCDRLGVDALVVHPGAHLGAGVERGVERAGDAVAEARERAGAGRTRLLLENTAGQGTLLGRTLEELAAIRGRADLGARVGVCIDTCHAFAAGHPIDEAGGWRLFLERLEDTLGRAAIGALHLNDSQAPRGSCRDRHANLGAGLVGIAAFRRIVVDPRLRDVPMIVETPLGADQRGHARDLDVLRRLRAKRALRDRDERRGVPGCSGRRVTPGAGS